MKILTLALFVGLRMAPAALAEDKPVHLFILSGQSNMARLDPKVSFIPAVNEAFGEDNVIVVKDAQSGQPIRRWYKKWKPADGPMPENNGDLYDRLMKKVDAAIEGKTLASVTFVWMQGERDAREKYGDVYAEALGGLIKQVADDLHHKPINFVIGRLSDYDMANRRYAHWTMVRDVQVAIAKESKHGAWVDTDDLNDKPAKDDNTKTRNDLHYTREGYKILGQRFADKAIALVKGEE